MGNEQLLWAAFGAINLLAIGALCLIVGGVLLLIERWPR